MKKLWISAILGLLFLGSCADKKENREEFKEEHNKDSLETEWEILPLPIQKTTTPSDSTKTASDSTKMK
jgi:protein involved in sex pheromone biosynthesis